MSLSDQIIQPAQVVGAGGSASDLSADGIRAVVSGTSGVGKAILDDGSSGLEWGDVGGSTGQLIIHALRITSNQTGLSGSAALNTVILNSIPTNLGGYFTESSGVWTCAIACTVRIKAQVYQLNTITGNTLAIYKGSTAEAFSQPAVSSNTACVIAADKILSFVEGQTFKITIAGGTAPAVGYGDGLSWLQVSLVEA